MTAWTNPFIGLPYADLGRDRRGVDCWGLVWLVYRDVAGVTLPSYAGDYLHAEERTEIDGLIGAAKRGTVWLPVDRSYIRPLDLVVFRAGQFDVHVGIISHPARSFMLHAASGHGSRLDSFEDARWGRRLSGFYRHPGVAVSL